MSLIFFAFQRSHIAHLKIDHFTQFAKLLEHTSIKQPVRKSERAFDVGQ